MLPEEISSYRAEKGFDQKNISEYCEEMKEHLQKKLKEEEIHLKERWSALAAYTVQHLCGMNTTLVLWH